MGALVESLAPEDAKLVTLARASRVRVNALQGAAVRDGDGRTYTAASIDLPSLQLSALQLAIAMAVSSGAPDVVAAAIVGDRPAHQLDAAGVSAVRDVSESAPILLAEADGTVVGTA